MAINQKMEVTQASVVIFFLVGMTLLQGLAAKYDKVEIERQLKLLNKPPVKSFQTSYGDIIDCVEIHKQLAFDHPLLKNHSIQMKPTNHEDILKQVRSSSSILRASQLPKNMRCPKGTVPTKRIQEQDLEMLKFAPSFAKILSISNSSQANDRREDHKIAGVFMPAENSGIYGIINGWQLEVTKDQLSAAVIYVTNADGSVNNGIVVGWSRDNGIRTGCFNTLCPGFVQIDKDFFPGMILKPMSVYEGRQYDAEMFITQDGMTKNWWFYIGNRAIGYFPKRIFTTLAEKAIGGGWGGEISSPPKEASPPMGSGHLPSEGFTKACYIREMKMFDTNSYVPSLFYPDKNRLEKLATKPMCYDVLYGDTWEGHIVVLHHAIFFGGPPNCTY